MHSSVENATAQIAKVKTKFWYPIGKTVGLIGQGFDTHGDILELKGFPLKVFCFRNPDQVAEILKHPQVGMTKFPQIMPRVQYLMGEGGYVLEGGEQWKQRRRIIQEAFKGQSIRHYAEQIPAIAQSLIEHWQIYASQGGAFDICRDLQALITHASLKTFLSVDLAEGGNPLTSSKIDEVRMLTHYIELRLVKPVPLWLPTPENIKFRHSYRRLKEIMLELVRQRRTQKKDSADMLAVLLNVEMPQSQRPWTDEDIVEEIFSVYFGASVMATTLAWALYSIATHQDVQDKLRSEYEAKVSDHAFQLDDLEHLPYNLKVYQEVLRLYPPSWGYPRKTLEQVSIGGRTIPPGALVIPMVYHSHRHPGYWKNPESFDPERFDSDQTPKNNRFLYYPFGGGARMCLGANLAPFILRTLIAMTTAHLKFEFKPRFAGDPIADFGFEIHPRDQVLMSLQVV